MEKCLQSFEGKRFQPRILYLDELKSSVRLEHFQTCKDFTKGSMCFAQTQERLHFQGDKTARQLWRMTYQIGAGQKALREASLGRWNLVEYLIFPNVLRFRHEAKLLGLNYSLEQVKQSEVRW